MTTNSSDAHVFNVVWTGQTFDHLQLFVASLLGHSDARFRFIANACPATQIESMERFAAHHGDRIVEVVEVSSQTMLRHGTALDEVFRTRHDGEHFCFVDADIAATGPFLADFDDLLATNAAVTSGREVWSTDNVRPDQHPGVSGEHFYDHDGYTFGSPHLAMYRRAAVAETIDRWGVGFGSTGNDLPERTRARLVEVGRGYWVYDTAKIVNILLQADGHRLQHQEHPHLIHIGGVSHFLAPPSSAPAAAGKPPRWGEGPDWGRQDGMSNRYEVARYTATVLEDLCSGREAPPLPTIDPRLQDRLGLARTTLIDLVRSYGPPITADAPRRLDERPT